MSRSLRTRVTGFIIVVIVATSLISTTFSLSVQKKGIERELHARGAALVEALARNVDEGLAMEKLDLIRYVEDFVHTKDVLLTQVFSIVWLGVGAVPREQLNTPPAPQAVEFFKEKQNVDEQKLFTMSDGPWIDIYSPVLYDPRDDRITRRPHIGYVRLRLSTASIRQSLIEGMISSIGAALLLTFLTVIVLEILMQKYVLRPILHLHTAMAKRREGGHAEVVPIETDDEIGDVTAEFNEMSRALREREELIAEEKERLIVTLRSIGDGVIVTNTGGTVTLINKVAEQLTGWPSQEATGKPLAAIFPVINERTREQCEDPVGKVIRTGQIIALAKNTALIRRDGTELVIEDSAAPIRDQSSRIIGVVIVFRDMTAKRRLEEERIKTEKLQSVGLLAGGLAHDFNNLLTSIVGNISVAKMYTDAGTKIYDRLTEAESASRRAAELTAQLLTFSRGGAPVRKTGSIADIIREASRFALSGTAVAADFHIASDVWNVNIDAGQISQVFNNLTINAVQAMPGGGKVVYVADNVILGENEVTPLSPGRYVRVMVRDTGSGIAAEHLPRIFEPYFTTKESGSGLGLASVYSIVKNHDGHITVASSEKGTTFFIYFPASFGARSRDVFSDKGIVGGRGKVLVMDDEEMIRNISGEMLRALGYEVVFARDGMEAVARYQEALAGERRIDIVIMDLTIPGGMGGEETIRKLRDLDPAVKAIVSSGYSNDPIMADYRTYGFRGVIVKPYDITNFSKVVQEVMLEG
jgi:PAS domain S-box-containing protein